MISAKLNSRICCKRYIKEISRCKIVIKKCKINDEFQKTDKKLCEHSIKKYLNQIYLFSQIAFVCSTAISQNV